MKRILPTFCLLALLGCSAQPPEVPRRVLDWEPAIASFEKADEDAPPKKGGTLFIGSSSIRMWKSLARDFPEYNVINRGFGGSHIEDSIHYSARIVDPYEPGTVVLYAGDNDIAAGKTPERVLKDFRLFARKLRWQRPRTRVVFIAIKPSPSRWKLVRKMREANHLIQGFIRTQPYMAYADTFTPMLDTDGKPKNALYAEDGLHLSPAGYRLWRDILSPLLAPPET